MAATKTKEPDRSAVGRNAEGGTEAKTPVESARDTGEAPKRDRTSSRTTAQKQSRDEPDRVTELRSAQGLGGTGDTGEARTIEEREEAASASSYKGGTARDTPDNEVQMREEGGLFSRQAEELRRSEEAGADATADQPQMHNQEAAAYYHSAFRDAARTVRGAINGVRAVLSTQRTTDLPITEEHQAALRDLEQAIDRFQRDTGAY